MSRYKYWNYAWSGIANYLNKIGLNLSHKQIDLIVINFCKKNNFKGSLTDKYINVSDNFKSFRDFVKASEKIV